MAFKVPGGFLLDLNGVFYVDNEVLPGGVESIEAMRSAGLPRRFTTNSTTKSIDQLHDRLTEMGLPIERDEIISPAHAAALYLKREGKPTVHLIVADNIKQDFAAFKESHTNPDYIVIGDIGERWNYQIMNRVFEMMMYGAQILALHKGRYWQVGNSLKLDIGAFITGLEYATGKEAIVIGKPTPSFFEMALNDMGIAAGDACMIGDDIENDVGGAQAIGAQGILVKTGKFRPELVARSSHRPDHVMDSIADLAKLIPG